MYQFPAIGDENLFQDFICDLFNEIYKTKSFSKFGGKGHSQKGIDVFSSEEKIVVQCKKKDLIRRQISLRKELMDEIENEPKKTLQNGLQIKFSRFIIASTYKDHPDLQEYCSVIKEKYKFDFELEYWGWDKLSHLLQDYKYIIKKYYSQFDLTELFNNKEKELLRSLEIKKRITSDFDLNVLNYTRIIIKNFEKNDYPYAEINENKGISSWFRAKAWKVTQNGLEIRIFTNSKIIEDSNGFWDILEWEDIRGRMYDKNDLMVIGKIPFKNIIAYDLEGDEYYNEPHFYCYYSNEKEPFGEPYEELEYYKGIIGSNEKTEYHRLDLEDKHILPIKKNNKRLTPRGCQSLAKRGGLAVTLPLSLITK